MAESVPLYKSYGSRTCLGIALVGIMEELPPVS